MISYCIACYRSAYARRLIRELVEKTTAPFEILVWLNLADPEFEAFLMERREAGIDLRIVGRTPENIGMAAYPHLFASSRYEMVTQIDDDVVCVSPGIAETAEAVFARFPSAGMLTADVWQDEYTTGARPPMEQYRLFDPGFELYEGPIDGWFAVYRKASLLRCQDIRPGRYFCLGFAIKGRLRSFGQYGVLCRRMKVFHVIGPHYAAHFGMLEAEIAKYRSVGRQDCVDWYEGARAELPPVDGLADRVRQIQESLSCFPPG